MGLGVAELFKSQTDRQAGKNRVVSIYLVDSNCTVLYTYLSSS
jgi:hypothetical protein